jgi:hypothetical protein
MTYSNSFSVAGGYFKIKLYEQFIVFQPTQGNNPKFATYEAGAVYTRDGQEVYFTIKDSDHKFLTPEDRNQLSDAFSSYVTKLTPADFREMATTEIKDQIAEAERSRSYSDTRIKTLQETLEYRTRDNEQQTALEAELLAIK